MSISKTSVNFCLVITLSIFMSNYNVLAASGMMLITKYFFLFCYLSDILIILREIVEGFTFFKNICESKYLEMNIRFSPIIVFLRICFFLKLIWTWYWLIYWGCICTGPPNCIAQCMPRKYGVRECLHDCVMNGYSYGTCAPPYLTGKCCCTRER